MSKHAPFLLKATAAVLAIQSVVGVALFYSIPDWATRGQFGDMFGIVNSLFSGLAFSGLIYTIFLQQQELSLQREELQLTRAELKRSAEAQEKSEKALTIQANASNQSARLAAVNYLLAHYERELELYRGMAFIGNDPRLERKITLEQKRQVLLTKLDTVFNEIIQPE